MIKWVFIFIILLSSVFINGSPFIFGDGYGYYHTAKTLSTKGQLVTQDEPSYFEYTGHAVNKDARGNYSTDYPFGSSIFWLPGLTFSKLIDSPDNYYEAFNGHSLNDGIAILLTATLVLFASVVLTYKILQKLGFSNRNSMFSVLAVYISMYIFSNLYYFSSYAHINELFSFTLVLYLFLCTLQSPIRRNWLGFGLAIGLLTVTRPADIVLTLPFVFYIIYKHRIKSGLYIALAGLPFAIAFFYYNFVSFGSPFMFGHNSEQFSLSNFSLINILFSDIRGLFIWSPLIIIASVSIFYFAVKNSQPIYKLGSAAYLLFLILYNFWPNWWGGDSLGQRFFIVLSPIFALGIAKFLSSNRSKHIVLWSTTFFVLCLTVFSLIVQLLYRVTPVQTIHDTDTEVSGTIIIKEERFTPFDILNYHTSAVNRLGVSTDYASLLLRSFNGGRSLLLLAIGQTDPLVKAEATDSIITIFLEPNTKGIFPSDLELIFEFKDQLYEVKDISPGTAEINIDCSQVCMSEQVKVKISDKILSLTDVNAHFRVGLTSSSRVNLINRKLK